MFHDSEVLNFYKYSDEKESTSYVFVSSVLAD